MLAVGLGVMGAGLTLALYGAAAVPVVGWIIAGLGFLWSVFSFFSGLAEDDCEPITVEYVCQSYSPPLGGDDCHRCHEKEDMGMTCNKYKCESLGTACMLINPGETYEECVAIENDGVPPLVTGVDISEDINIELGPNGFGYAEITPIGGGCFDAYETILPGLTLTEPAKCKFSTDVEMPFSEMREYFGVSSMLATQYESIFIPDPSNGQSQGINWQGDMEFHIKCQDAYGDISPEFYRLSFCVNEGDDTRAPTIDRFRPENGGLSSFDLDEQEVTITTNEPAQCRWSSNKVGYDAMPAENQMTCNYDISPSFTWNRPFQCTATLPTPNAVNTFYIDCKDQPWLGEESTERNSKYASEEYILKKPEKKIEIDWIEPNEAIETGVSPTSIEIKVKTSGGGKTHLCKWSMSGFSSMVEMPLTANRGNTHTLPEVNLNKGWKTVYVNCSDETGDTASASSRFEIRHDKSYPEITRLWQESGKLHIITDETATCKYSTEECNFDWEEAEIISGNYEYILPVVRGQRYYIKCEDQFGNKPTVGCSKEIMAV
jgi:hypothetical protein